MADRVLESLMGLSGITYGMNETHAALGNAAADIVRLRQQLVEIQAQKDARPNITVEEHQQLRRDLAAAQAAGNQATIAEHIALIRAEQQAHDAEEAQHNAERQRDEALLTQQNVNAARLVAERDLDEARQAYARAEGKFNDHNFPVEVNLAARLHNIEVAIAGVSALHIADAQEAAMYTEMLQRVKAATEREIAEQATVAEHAALVQARAAFANAQLRLAALGLNLTVAAIDIALVNINVDVADVNERAIYQRLLENERALAQTQADLAARQAALTAEQAARVGAEGRAHNAEALRLAALAAQGVAEGRLAAAEVLRADDAALVPGLRAQLAALPGLQAAAREGDRARRFVNSSSGLKSSFIHFV